MNFCLMQGLYNNFAGQFFYYQGVLHIFFRISFVTQVVEKEHGIDIFLSLSLFLSSSLSLSISFFLSFSLYFFLSLSLYPSISLSLYLSLSLPLSLSIPLSRQSLPVVNLYDVFQSIIIKMCSVCMFSLWDCGRSDV